MDTIAQIDSFFAGNQEAWTLFETFRRLVMDRWPQARIRVMKTCISLDDPRPFVYVSHPPRKNLGGLRVTFSLREREEHPRFFRVVPISKNRFTVHVQVKDAEEIDGELLGWIEAARH